LKVSYDCRPAPQHVMSSHWAEIFYSISSPMEESQLVAAAPLLCVHPEVCCSGENFAEPPHALH
jgi:hypothetical protein